MGNSNPAIDPKEAIVSRTLAVIDRDSNTLSPVSILIGKPWQDQDCWTCYWCVLGIGDDDSYKVCGIDGIQAVQGAIVVIDGLLAGSDVYHQGLLCWPDGSDWQPERDYD
jgi:hypothetical protein